MNKIGKRSFCRNPNEKLLILVNFGIYCVSAYSNWKLIIFEAIGTICSPLKFILFTSCLYLHWDLAILFKFMNFLTVIVVTGFWMKMNQWSVLKSDSLHVFWNFKIFSRLPGFFYFVIRGIYSIYSYWWFWSS